MHFDSRKGQFDSTNEERQVYAPDFCKANTCAKLTDYLDDGYRLTYGGLDYLALHTHLKRSTVYSTGNCIGVGKESDIYVVASASGRQIILKIHRLGRISFRSIKNNRDYLKHRTSANWMHMSRLSALKEYAFMKALRENGFNVPEPIAQSRHTIVMELVDAFPLRQIQSVPDPAELYADLINIILRLASFGLIHGDFNEFNILLKEDQVNEDCGTRTNPDKNSGISVSFPSIKQRPVIIDFPQMVSIDHMNGQMYFDRDVNCIKRFFERRFNFVSDESGPYFSDARKLAGGVNSKRLDVDVEASGFSKKMAKELENYMQIIRLEGDRGWIEDGMEGEMISTVCDDSSEQEQVAEDSHNDRNDVNDRYCINSQPITETWSGAADSPDDLVNVDQRHF